MTDKQILGEKGEKAVAEFLKKNKYKIITRNYSSKTGEIDIIAENKEYIAFVEVKTRHAGQMLSPQFAVGVRKQRRIMLTAAGFLKQYMYDKQPRFDVAEVIVYDKGKPDINYIENAFTQGGDYAPF